MKVIHVVGARPNFMKLAPLQRALSQTPILQQVIHTGQHYDAFMSDIFFEQLQIPRPDFHLGIGSGTHSVQTAKMMIALEEILVQQKPDWVIVYGDVNSTLAAALVCAKNYIKICHVEAGLRSYDRTMPEEINRIVTDRLSDLLLTPSPDANENLLKEGIIPEKIIFVGNIMIDSLHWSLKWIEKNPHAVHLAQNLMKKYELKTSKFILVTLHRPSNVDDEQKLQKVITTLGEISFQIPVLFPVHPRTQKMLEGLSNAKYPQLYYEQPLGYMDFLYLQQHALALVTDSGGIQEETTALGIPCLTLRENTERPITIAQGTNQLIGNDFEKLKYELQEIVQGRGKKGSIPELWDGKTAERIKEIFLRML
jgi:UDP-N-acetylglucosamine 2-epimerase (non-hydrolysing)